MTGPALTWAEMLEHCSRLHTTRTRPRWPGATETREWAQLLPVFVWGIPATIIPTRMHEPGFYGQSVTGRTYWRDPAGIERLAAAVALGRVCIRIIDPLDDIREDIQNGS